MGEIAAVISDLADCREFVCVLPDNASVSAVAGRLAELARFPRAGPQGEAIRYGLIPKCGPEVDPNSTLRKIDLPEPLSLRLVPELTIGAKQAGLPIPEEQPFYEPPPRVAVVQERCLLHDEELSRKPDIAIDATAHREIEQFAQRDRLAECGGLLLGTVEVEQKARLIHIKAVAPAVGAIETRTNFKITFKAWKSMFDLRDAEYPDLRVLGWFHAHAGWGVFLSEIDLFVHERFFPHPNMVAFVIDPTVGGESFFYWRDGQVVQCPTYSLFGLPHQTSASKRFGRRRVVVVGACAAAVLGVGLYAGIAVPRMSPPKPAAVAARRSVPIGVPKSLEPRAKIYVLREGETLWDLCGRFYNDETLGIALAWYNRIHEPRRVRVGTRITLPPVEELKKMRR
ncbi:MAG: LysM peptidoglycan-binding domain-containing protein [Armatimonadetes bacterium]|nr:LysM peptidoglycan-binding domain-containing protein [Armatimonadota bacterium]